MSSSTPVLPDYLCIGSDDPLVFASDLRQEYRRRTDQEFHRIGVRRAGNDAIQQGRIGGHAAVHLPVSGDEDFAHLGNPRGSA